jgi:Asp-tRNA(Asn)/Glu-tRNA(Gln) amidotransferase A subunit family amidase
MITDLHAQAQAIAAGKDSLQDALLRAREISLEAACAHAYTQHPADVLAAAAGTSAGRVNGQAGATGALAGLPVSVKDLFDVHGQATLAGSTALAGAAPAAADCPAVARLRKAGGLIAGRTNMSEFAFSGVGINPHYGTPANPADRQVARITGGSSSGAAVSVATGAAFVGLGSDTGGSIRIPAALCGLVGFKSTARLVPTAGALPLSTTLDTVCALTRSVRDAVTVHEILSNRRVALAGKPLSASRFAVARTLMQDGLDDGVAQAFENSLRVLRAAGAQIIEIPLTELSELAGINATGGLSAAESYAWHRPLIARHQALYDPRVALRILKGASMSAADYIDLVAARQNWIGRMNVLLAGFDAVLSPTVPMIAPPVAELIDDDVNFFRVNGLLLRNTAVVNMLDGCGISLPCFAPQNSATKLPVGLMLWQAALHDDALLDTSLQVEAALNSARGSDNPSHVRLA